MSSSKLFSLLIKWFQKSATAHVNGRAIRYIKKSKLGQLMQEGSIESQAIRTRLSAAFGEVQKVKEGNNILLNKKLKCYSMSLWFFSSLFLVLGYRKYQDQTQNLLNFCVSSTSNKMLRKVEWRNIKAREVPKLQIPLLGHLFKHSILMTLYYIASLLQSKILFISFQ